jgi:HAD superfamily hydrolase (TIGR01509 family)
LSGTRGVLWDLDGTLIDSSGLHWEAWRDTLASFGRSVGPREFALSFGKRNDEILISLYGRGLDPSWMARVSDEKELAYRRLVRERGVVPMPGATSWLERLRAHGWKQALASSAPPANIEATLVALGLTRWLDAVVSAEEVGRGKPDPAIFLEAARRLDAPAARCVVVEDAPAGIEGAHRAGMRAIGVLSSHHAQLEADVVVPSLEDLSPSAFDELLGPG